MKKLLAMMLAGAASVSAGAAHWVDLGKSAEEDIQTFIDIESARKYYDEPFFSSESYSSAFIRYDYLKGHRLKPLGGSYSYNFYIVDCDKISLFSPSTVIYGTKNEVLMNSNEKHFTSRSLTKAYPDTVGERIVRNICAYSMINDLI